MTYIVLKAPLYSNQPTNQPCTVVIFILAVNFALLVCNLFIHLSSDLYELYVTQMISMSQHFG